jgi:hypothetical protein
MNLDIAIMLFEERERGKSIGVRIFVLRHPPWLDVFVAWWLND